MELALGSWNGIWGKGWRHLVGMTFEYKEAKCYGLVVMGEKGEGEVWAVVGDAWEFEVVDKWSVEPGYDQMVGLTAPCAHCELNGAKQGGHFLVHNTTTSHYHLYEVAPSGRIALGLSDTFPVQHTTFVSFEHPSYPSPHLLGYHAPTGAFTVYSMPFLEPLTSGSFSPFWTDIVPKKPAPRKWTEGSHRHPVNRFYCYNNSTGEGCFESIGDGAHELTGKPNIEKRKPGCKILAIDCGGKSCCMFYKHTQLAEQGAKSKPEEPRANEARPPDAASMLHKRIRCHREAWTSFELFPMLPVVDAIHWRHLLCYNLQSGVWWICAIKAQACMQPLTVEPRVPTPGADEKVHTAWPGRGGLTLTRNRSSMKKPLEPTPPTKKPKKRPNRLDWSKPWSHHSWEAKNTRKEKEGGLQKIIVKEAPPDDEAEGVRMILRRLAEHPFYSSTRYADLAVASLPNATLRAPSRLGDPMKPCWKATNNTVSPPGEPNRKIEKYVRDKVSRRPVSSDAERLRRLERLAQPVSIEARSRARLLSELKTEPRAARLFTPAEQEKSVYRMSVRNSKRKEENREALCTTMWSMHETTPKKTPLYEITERLHTGQVSLKEDAMSRCLAKWLAAPNSTKSTPEQQQQLIERLYQQALSEIIRRQREAEQLRETPVFSPPQITRKTLAKMVDRLYPIPSGS